MIMVQDKEGKVHQPGIAKIRKLIQERINYVVDWFVEKQYSLSIDNQDSPLLSLKDIFDEPTTLDRLCGVTGGHLRAVMILMQESINLIECLPITRKAVERSIAISRNTYNNTVDYPDWDRLAKIAKSKKIVNEDQYRQLLFDRFVK